MAAEADNPQTGTIAWVTAISLILIFVVFVVLQGLFEIWEVRHENRVGIGNLESPIAAYTKEQKLKLGSLDAAKKATLEDARAGKVLAAPAPPAAPATPAKTPTK